MSDGEMLIVGAVALAAAMFLGKKTSNASGSPDGSSTPTPGGSGSYAYVPGVGVSLPGTASQIINAGAGSGLPEGTMLITSAAADSGNIYPIMPGDPGSATSQIAIYPSGGVVTRFHQGGYTDVGEPLDSPAALLQLQRQIQGEYQQYGRRTTTIQKSAESPTGVAIVGQAAQLATAIEAAASGGDWELVKSLQQQIGTTRSGGSSSGSSGVQHNETTRVNNLGRTVTKVGGHWVEG